MDTWQAVVLAAIAAVQVVLLAWIGRRTGTSTREAAAMLARFEDKIRKRVERLPDNGGPAGGLSQPPPPDDMNPFWRHVMEEWHKKQEGGG